MQASENYNFYSQNNIKITRTPGESITICLAFICESTIYKNTNWLIDDHKMQECACFSRVFKI